MQCLAYGNAAREREHADALVRREQPPDCTARTVDEVEAARRQPRLLKHVDEEGRRERCRRGGLIDDGIARRERGTDLVDGEVHGEVERRDRADNAERTADRKRHAISAAGSTR